MNIEHWTRDMEKQVGHRLDIILSDPRFLSIHQKFGGRIFRRSSIFHGLDRFLSEQGVQGKVCFEVGTWHGLTAIVLSSYFEHVVTVDVAHNSIKRDIIAHLGIGNIECIDIESNADKARIANGLDFDFAYLDGNHAEDTETDFSLVRKCGRVLFHEVWPFQPPVWVKVQSLPASQVVRGGFGLALWEAGRG